METLWFFLNICTINQKIVFVKDTRNETRGRALTQITWSTRCQLMLSQGTVPLCSRCPQVIEFSICRIKSCRHREVRLDYRFSWRWSRNVASGPKRRISQTLPGKGGTDNSRGWRLRSHYGILIWKNKFLSTLRNFSLRWHTVSDIVANIDSLRRVVSFCRVPFRLLVKIIDTSN